ncbi:class I SAM-dependent methyltransferase [Aquabacterium sp.]|uniref:class I SAM-dependent methyltransferase n=1 Tax=Aquabacterium sp. TaxID=1872578 RepID=UPI002C735DD0|nr:class I SAM-dependent methyltransferase [Aquabacterium sp.]HSW05416.1 class I SAM-dependent methyltransferase [Aquabacterium sp.]
MNEAHPHITWTDNEGQAQQARWLSLAGHPPPKRVRVVDDSLNADAAYKLACEGTGLLWVGDFHNARQLLQALGRRIDSKAERGAKRGAGIAKPAAHLKDAFHAHRQAQALRARVLGMLLLPFESDHGVPLRRAPDVRQAGLEAHGAMAEHYVASLRELQGLIGAFEWRKKGVEIPALKDRIHPHHGVFSPVRGEYVELVAQAPLPAASKNAGAFDIGTGTGVLAAVLARRGVKPLQATDLDPRALACAQDNLARLGLAERVKLVQADLFPKGKAGLIVCNPPWVPARPSSPLESAVYDPDSAMLRGWLAGLAAHLAPGGEGWLILSDLAEHLGLRSRDELLGWIHDAGLQVLGRLDTRPAHRRAADTSDPLHAARSAEVTSLWRLGAMTRP